MSDYASRLSISLVGDGVTQFFTKSGDCIAIGYDRVVIGDRGPCVEFDAVHLLHDRFKESDEKHFYYVELRTLSDDVKVYFQIHRVDYADYLPGKCYISPFELYDKQSQVLIESLKVV